MLNAVNNYFLNSVLLVCGKIGSFLCPMPLWTTMAGCLQKNRAYHTLKVLKIYVLT